MDAMTWLWPGLTLLICGAAIEAFWFVADHVHDDEVPPPPAWLAAACGPGDGTPRRDPGPRTFTHAAAAYQPAS